MEEIVYHTNYKLENSYWWFIARNHIAKKLIYKKTDLQKGDYILDIGCGTGGFAQLISDSFIPICLDTSRLAIDYCKKRGIEHCFVSTINDFQLDEFNVKAAVMLDVIEHIENDREIINVVFDKLPHGAWFIATVPAYKALWSRHDEIHQHYRRYNKIEFNNLLREAGFNVCYSSYFNTFLFLPALAKRFLDKLTGADKKITEPVEQVSPAINSIFKNIFLLEDKFLGKIVFPFGLSIVTIARKI